MSQQLNKVQKRRRRAAHLKRKKVATRARSSKPAATSAEAAS